MKLELDGLTKEFGKILWNGGDLKYDIRDWASHMKK